MSEPTVAELQARVALLERALRTAAGDCWVLGEYGRCPKGQPTRPDRHGFAWSECASCNPSGQKDGDFAACWYEFYLADAQAAKEAASE